MPFSTRKPLTLPSSVRAHTTATSASEPLVIHIFEPLRTQPVVRSSSRACASPAGLEPASGSVSPKQPIVVPAAMPGSQRLLLLLAAPAMDREHRQRALHRAERAQPGVARLELQAREPVRRRRRARAAVALEVHARADPAAPSSGPVVSGSDPVLEVLAHRGRNFSRTYWRTVSRISRSSSSSSASSASGSTRSRRREAWQGSAADMPLSAVRQPVRPDRVLGLMYARRVRGRTCGPGPLIARCGSSCCSDGPSAPPTAPSPARSSRG